MLSIARGGKLIVVQPQFAQLGQCAKLRRQGGELVLVQPQPCQLAQRPDLRRQAAELIVAQPQDAQGGERPEFGGECGQPQPGQIQPPAPLAARGGDALLGDLVAYRCRSPALRFCARQYVTGIPRDPALPQAREDRESISAFG